MDATAQADLVRRGEVSSRELVAAAIERIERSRATVNAVSIETFDDALRASETARSGPFSGVPTLLKDGTIEQSDLPFHQSNIALKRIDHRSSRDSDLGRRVRDLGFITLGRSNAPEFGIQTTTQPLTCGPTANPWSLSHSVNGSSGGAAAAVAAGLVPVAHAADGGGSIRLPAAWTNLVGLKPSRGAMAIAPGFLSFTAVEFFITRTVRDARALWNAVAGPAESDLFQSAARGAAARPLTIGMVTSLDHTPSRAECADAVLEAARALEKVGHHITEDAPPALLHLDWLADARVVTASDIAGRFSALRALLGRDLGQDDMEPYSWAVYQAMRTAPSAELLHAALARLERWSIEMLSWWDDHDLLLCPVCHEPPATLAEMDASRVGVASVQARTAAHVRYTQPFNVSGQPAISVPVGVTAGGLPVGVQLVARTGHEPLLLEVAASLEEVFRWPDRWPPAAQQAGDR